MTDRTPTEVLANGALRYGIYNADGTLNRYEYIKPEDAPTQEGTPLNKAMLLSDATAALYGLGAEALPDDMLALIKSLLNEKARVAVGSYVGTGTRGAQNKNSLTFPFVPKALVLYGSGKKDSTSSVITFQICIPNVSSQSAPSGYFVLEFSAWENTVTWHTDLTNPGQQANELDKTYQYVALG